MNESNISAAGSCSRFICRNSKAISNNDCFCCVIFSVWHRLIWQFYIYSSGLLDWLWGNRLLQRDLRNPKICAWNRLILNPDKIYENANGTDKFWGALYVECSRLIQPLFILRSFSHLTFMQYMWFCFMSIFLLHHFSMINWKILITNHKPSVRVRWSNNGKRSVSFLVLTSAFIGLWNLSKHPCHSWIWMSFPKIAPEISSTRYQQFAL